MDVEQEADVQYGYVEVPAAIDASKYNKIEDNIKYYEVPLVEESDEDEDDARDRGESSEWSQEVADEDQESMHGRNNTREEEDFDISQTNKKYKQNTHDVQKDARNVPDNNTTASTSHYRRPKFNFYMGNLFTNNKEENLRKNYETDGGNDDNDKPYACDQCSYRSKLPGTMRQHQLVHSDDKPFHCNECPYKCKLSANLRKHKAIHEENKIFAPELMQFHNRQSNAAAIFQCNQCGLSYSDIAMLRKHKLYECEDNITRNELRPFQCAQCPYRCKVAANLRIHMTTHSDHKPYGCELCSYRCKLPGTLRQHMIVHSDVKPFACDVCDYRAKFAANLRKHKLIHSDRESLACDGCEFKCKTLIRLQKHKMMMHSGGKMEACRIDDDGNEDL